jgi:glutathionyl-hydroquinone reductase
VVNNADEDILADLVTQFSSHRKTSVDLYPVDLRKEIDLFDTDLHAKVNLGVYRAGILASQHNQQAYESTVIEIFHTLDALEDRLEHRRYLWGHKITVSDLRLYVTLARFDVVYNQLFKANLRRIVDYPNLWAYARDL